MFIFCEQKFDLIVFEKGKKLNELYSVWIFQLFLKFLFSKTFIFGF